MGVEKVLIFLIFFFSFFFSFLLGLFETRFREWEAECKLNQNKFGAKVKKIGRAVKGISRDGGKKLSLLMLCHGPRG